MITEKTLKNFDKKKILEIQQNRDPFLMIDYAEEIVMKKSVKGYKDFNNNEWFFKVHWPSDPNVPGVLQIECLFQSASLAILAMPENKGKVMYVSSLDKVRFLKKITPGKRLNIDANIESFNRGIAKSKAEGRVDGELAVKAEFSLVLPNEIKKYI